MKKINQKKSTQKKDKPRPPSTVTRNKEPNIDLMAKAFIQLYEETKGKKG